MNYIIGMCKKHENWIQILRDLGYDPSVIEQRIRTSSGDTIRPDIVITSNKLLHSLVFECKGGITVDPDQFERYGTLTKEDLMRWISVYTFHNFNFDVCIADLRKNHPAIFPYAVNKFPMITFGNDEILKTGKFSNKRIDKALEKPISIEEKIPPLFYYPFCEEDETSYVIPFIMRGLVSVAIKKTKGGAGIPDKELVQKEEIVEEVFSRVFNILSTKQQGRLKKMITEILNIILSDEETKESLGIIEFRGGYKITNQLTKLQKEAEKIIDKYKTQKFITNFSS